MFRSSPASLSHARPRRTSHLSTTLSGPGSNVESFEMAFLSQGSDPVSKSRTIGEQNPLKNHPKRSSRKQVHLQVRPKNSSRTEPPTKLSEPIRAETGSFAGSNSRTIREPNSSNFLRSDLAKIKVHLQVQNREQLRTEPPKYPPKP